MSIEGEESSELLATRRRKLEALREAGIDPFPHAFPGVTPIAEVKAPHEGLEPGQETDVRVRVAGRLHARRGGGKAASCRVAAWPGGGGNAESWRGAEACPGGGGKAGSCRAAEFCPGGGGNAPLGLPCTGDGRNCAATGETLAKSRTHAPANPN